MSTTSAILSYGVSVFVVVFAVYAEHRDEPEETPEGTLPHPLVALLPLVVVILSNKVFAGLIAVRYDHSYTMQLAGMAKPVTVEVSTLVAVWSVEGALLLGILLDGRSAGEISALGWLREARLRWRAQCSRR